MNPCYSENLPEAVNNLLSPARVSASGRRIRLVRRAAFL